MSLLICTDDERKRILQVYNRDEASLKEDVECVKKWIKSQPHLPEVMDDRQIERFLTQNKFSIERTKERIDMYYTIRELVPEFYKNTNPKLPHMKFMLNATFVCPLPKLTKDLYRVQFLKINEDVDSVEQFDPNHYYMTTFHYAEIRSWEDINLSTILVYDFKGTTFGHISKFNPMHTKKAAMILNKVWGDRIAGIHIFNCPSYVETFLNAIKPFISQKLKERLHVHKDLSYLQQYFDKSILPKDYGGEERSLLELHELWKQKFEEYQPRFDILDSFKIDEKLRPEKLKNDDLLGFHGNFKSLAVD